MKVSSFLILFLSTLLVACGGGVSLPETRSSDLGGVHVGNPEETGNGLTASEAKREFRSSYGYHLSLPRKLYFSKDDIFSAEADFSSLEQNDTLEIKVLDPESGPKNLKDFELRMEDLVDQGFKLWDDTKERQEARRTLKDKENYVEERLVLTRHHQLLRIKIETPNKETFASLQKSIDRMSYDLDAPSLKEMSIEVDEETSTLLIRAEIPNEKMATRLDASIVISSIKSNRIEIEGFYRVRFEKDKEAGGDIFLAHIQLAPELDEGVYVLSRVEIEDRLENTAGFLIKSDPFTYFGYDYSVADRFDADGIDGSHLVDFYRTRQAPLRFDIGELED